MIQFYAHILALLGLASQRVEYLLIEWFGTDWMQEILEDWKRRERGSIPGPIELFIMLYIGGLFMKSNKFNRHFMWGKTSPIDF